GGQYVAVTGQGGDGEERGALGLATHYLPSDRLDDARGRILADPQAIEAVLADLTTPVPDARILAHREDIDRLFARDHLED
ncbi:enoyl-CoA hydratase/isomerase family protein, partial [Mycobacterium tuberculosis]|nr:enoyl-CoA hydratase/isomerase family protein [Mycobacterium tuberculosis]